jgi:Leucine-rich repeat (LRR) protein
MDKKQMDLSGNQASLEKVLQSEKVIKIKQIEQLFSRTALDSFLEIIKKNPQMLEWPVKAIISKVNYLKDTKKECFKNDFYANIFDRFIKALDELKLTQDHEESRRIFKKVYDKYLDLYLFSLKDTSDTIIQFFRILTLLHVFLGMEDAISYGSREELQYAMDKSGHYPKTKNEYRGELSEMESIVMADFSFIILEDEIRVSSGYYSYRSDLPLDFGDSLPPELKKRYTLPPDHPTVRMREKLRSFPEFFARICLNDDRRVKFEWMSNPETIIKLDLSNLGLGNLPSEIAYFSTVKELDLSKNGLHDLPESLRKLKSLQNLNLWGNPLDELPLSVHLLLARGVNVDLPDKKIKQLGEDQLFALAQEINKEKKRPEQFVFLNGRVFFAKRNKTLDLRNEKIEDIRSIKRLNELDELKELNITGGNITEIKGLEDLSSLETLSLHFNKINRISGLEGLKNLRVLWLSRNKISKIEGLDELRNLEQLFLDRNQIVKIEGLDNLVNLKVLHLEENRQIKRIEGLESLPSLTHLYLGKTGIKELEGLDSLQNLKYFSLESNHILEVKGLEHLINLEKFFVSYYIGLEKESPAELGNVWNDFKGEGRKWVNYCRRKLGMYLI